MELLSPIQPTCFVSGAHSFLLHVSRIAGIAPISFEKVHGGWRISMSWFFYVYCVLVEITIHTVISFTVYISRDELVDGYEPASNTGFMVIVTYVLGTIQLLVGLIIGVTGYHRLRLVIDSMAHLEQINKELDLLFVPPNTSELKTWIKLILLLLHGYVGSFMDGGIYMYDVIANNDTIPFAAFSMMVTYFNVVHLQLLAIQFHMAVITLVSTQKRLNNCLRSILDEFRKSSASSSVAWSSPIHVKYIKDFQISMPNRVTYRSTICDTPTTINGVYCKILSNKDNGMKGIVIIVHIPIMWEVLTSTLIWSVITAIVSAFENAGEKETEEEIKGKKTASGSQTHSEKIRQLIDIYCLQCNIVRKLNDGHGIPILMLLLYCVVYLVSSPYFVVTVLIRTHSTIPVFKMVAIFGYCSLCFAMIMVGTEPCHQSHIELKITKKLINQTMRYTPKESSAVYYQIKMFRRHILLNPVSFSPMHLLKFDRNLSVAVLSSIVTYLTVFINL